MADIPAERRKLLENAHRQVEVAIASRKVVETPDRNQQAVDRAFAAHPLEYESGTRITS
jgi:hypothetical protein